MQRPISQMSGKARILRLLVVALVVLGLPAYAAEKSKQDPAEVQQGETLKHLTKEAFGKSDQKIKVIKPGTTMDATGLNWKIVPIYENKELVGVYALCDGWIGSMSGRWSGALYQLGQFGGTSGNSIYGSHTFGYMAGKNMLVPRYSVVTEGTLINQREYDELMKAKTQNIGRYKYLKGHSTELFFKDLRVKEVKTLPFSEPTGVTDPSVSTASKSFKAFKEVEVKLNQLATGMEISNVINLLGGVFYSDDPANDYAIIGMKGFLNTNIDLRWTKEVQDNVYFAWPFGYKQGKREVPKIDVIFKNDKVFKVVPHAPKAKLEKLLD